MDKVTVLMPVYNCEKYIDESLDSILNQSYRNLEVIIVNDGSTDNTMKLIRNKKDCRIKIYDNEKNMGLPYTRNRLLSLATGDFIAMMDSDDISNYKRIEKQVNYLKKHKDIDIVGTNCIKFTDSKKISGFLNFSTDVEEIKIKLLFMNCISNPSAMVRKSFLDENKLTYNKEYFVAQDYEFWIRCSTKGRIVNLNEYLLKYRTGHSNITKKSKNKNGELRSSLLKKLHLQYIKGYGFKLSNMEEEIVGKILDDYKFEYDKNNIIEFKEILINLVKQNKSLNIFDNDTMVKVLGEVISNRISLAKISKKDKVQLLNETKKGFNKNKYFKYYIKSVIK